tara:strand:+ start:932 stop:1291 length:360 start_codon:yes stop_codon:yes gene_type:complete
LDKINILNLRLAGKHGVYDFEKKKEGVFELDIFLYLNLRSALLSDNLKDSVDYSKVVKLVKKIFFENDCNLIEYLASKICEGILEKYPIQKVVVKIRKPHAPIDANLDTVEVEIERIRK